MIEYIYLVKCPDRSEEPFDFFDEAKDFAIGCLSNNPIITQIEVDRNDFGECTDSRDLGTVWSWEDMVKETEAEPAVSVFTKDDFADYVPETDPEFAALDNTVEFEPDPNSFRKPIPDGMTIKDLVEEMEENEDTVECTWCEDLFDKSECRYEINLGWLCSRCQAAIMSRGETLTFRENSYWDFLDEDADLDIEETPKLLTWICEFDGQEIGTIEAATEEEAIEKMMSEYPEYHYGEYDGCFSVYLEEAIEKPKSMLEELEDADTYRERLTLCPECGGTTTFDNETGMCINCGFNTLSDLTEDVTEPALSEMVRDSIKRLTTDSDKLPDLEHAASFAFEVAEDIREKYNISFDKDFEASDKWYREVTKEVYSQLKQLHKESDDPTYRDTFLKKKFELFYPEIEVTMQSAKRDVDDWDEWTETVEYTYEVDNGDVIECLADLVQEEDVTDIEGGLYALENLPEEDYLAYFILNFYDLTEKYEQELLKHWEDDAASAAQQAAHEGLFDD